MQLTDNSKISPPQPQQVDATFKRIFNELMDCYGPTMGTQEVAKTIKLHKNTLYRMAKELPRAAGKGKSQSVFMTSDVALYIACRFDGAEIPFEKSVTESVTDCAAESVTAL